MAQKTTKTVTTKVKKPTTTKKTTTTKKPAASTKTPAAPTKKISTIIQTKPKLQKTKTNTKSKKTTKSTADKRLAIIRIRGINNVRRDINDTIGLMNLRRINNLSFVDNRVDYKGMLQKSKDFITWGEPSVPVVSAVFKKWGRVLGDKPLTDEFMKGNSNYKTIDEFAKAFVELKAEISDVITLKPFFRLHPPKGGFKGKGIKYAYKANGALGYRGSEIDALIKQMAGL
ncbi:MAG: 50S ribosomal protein L30P [Candidatus Heimdallarchaeota archaeon LC_3]|nr:MAG: 50S ribosomal protein L30P [Candidatus Heimdallarchaeota archaeon LC_3]